MSSTILFFDGVCNLCNSFINFIIKFDRKGKIKVASLQGESAKELIPSHFLKNLDTVILYKDGKFYTRTNAAIRALLEINNLFLPLAILLVIPSFIRDPFYKVVAAYRYKWFGRRDICRLPTPEEKSYFLD